jgi:MFS family permease
VQSPRTLAQTTFRSLHVRNYKLFFFGQGTSLIGTWMQTIALSWLVLDLSHNSGFAVGLTLALQFLPSLFLSPYGGVIADRFDKRKVLFVTQIVMAITALVLGFIVIADVVQLWMVLVLVLVFGVAQSIDNPTRLAFASEMVGEDDLSNAIGLNSTMFQMARIIGPSIAGVLIVVIGTGPCFLVNAVSYLALIAALMLMRPDELYRQAPVPAEKGQIREGMRYIWHMPELRLQLTLTFVVGTLAINYPVVLPLLAKITFHGNADTYSLFTVAMGVPALFGGLYLAHRAAATERFLFAAGILFGSAILAASLAPTLALFVVLIAIVGGFQILFMATTNTLTQLRADARMRGRVMSVHAMAVLGSTPIGGPLVGWISQQYGPRYGLAIGGVATLVGTLVLGGMIVRLRDRTDLSERERQADFAPVETVTAVAG